MIGLIILIGVLAGFCIFMLILFLHYKKKLEKFNPNKNSNVIEGIIEDVQVTNDGLICAIRRLDNNRVIKTDKLSKELVAKLNMDSIRYVNRHYEYDSILNNH